jgi:hypothetical protein
VSDIRVTVIGGPRLVGYTYFWAKTVRSFQPGHHCASCLVGEYCVTKPREPWPMNTELRIGLDGARYLYICGVSKRGWDHNLHVALDPKVRGKPLQIEMEQGQRLLVRGASRLVIPALPDGFDGRSMRFTTCRNWQFGVTYFGLGREPKGSGLF